MSEKNENRDDMSGDSAPITRREGDLIWKTIDELKQEVASRHKDIRDNFKTVFEKLDEGRACLAQRSNQSGVSKILTTIHLVVTSAAVVIGGIWFLILKAPQ